MKQFWIKKMIDIPTTLLLILCFIYVYVYLFYNKDIYYIDQLITQTNLISFSIHFAILFMIAKRNFFIKKGMMYILLRIDREKLINLFLKYIIIEILIFIFAIYIIPFILYGNYFLNTQLYFIYLLMWGCIFFAMEVCMILSVFIENKIISIVLLSLPFLVNILLQLNVMSLIYC